MKRDIHDLRVFRLVEGVQFCEELMFKTRIAEKTGDPIPSKATFGCIICCSKGKGTPVIDGIQSFMDHLGELRENINNEELPHEHPKREPSYPA